MGNCHDWLTKKEVSLQYFSFLSFFEAKIDDGKYGVWEWRDKLRWASFYSFLFVFIQTSEETKCIHIAQFWDWWPQSAISGLSHIQVFFFCSYRLSHSDVSLFFIVVFFLSSSALI